MSSLTTNYGAISTAIGPTNSTADRSSSSNATTNDSVTIGITNNSNNSNNKSALPAPDINHTGALLAHSRFFIDAESRRTLFLRGVNLSANVKQPFTPRIPSHELMGFFDHRNVSFVGRPFPLADAHEHLARLRSWGFNFLRFNVTWEAIEHAGPGIYDHEYIDYVVQVLHKAKQYGFRVFIDPHQDVWSRFSGGSGAPGWTLELAGFNMHHFAPTNAAIVQNTYPDPTHYPKMIWATNYFKLAAATMFTLFFAGRIFAPKFVVPGTTENIQDFLQRHYTGAIVALATAIHSAGGLEDDVVVGYDTLNEPGFGFIGCRDISELMETQELRKGLTPTPLQAMMLGSGFSCRDVQVWEIGSYGPQRIGTQSVDPAGLSAWSDTSAGCVWAQHGVWDPKTRRAILPDYFSKHPVTGDKIEFLRDAWMPFVKSFTESIRSVHRDAIIFVEPPVNAKPPAWNQQKGDPDGPICYAPHWYDGLTLLNKHFNPWFSVDYLGYLRGRYSHIMFALRVGEVGVRSAFRSQLKLLRNEGRESIGEYPCLIGEIGIPFDLDDKQAYMTGNYSAQVQAMDFNLSALEQSLLNFTLWNYCPDNTNLWGDQWNGEDLSIWSQPSVGAGAIMGTTMRDTDAPINATIDGLETKYQVNAKQTVRASDETVGSSSNDVGSINMGKALHDAKASDTIAPTVNLDAGARALEAFVRPYPIFTPGTPVSLEFDLKEKTFVYTFSHEIDLTTGLWPIQVDPESNHGDSGNDLKTPATTNGNLAPTEPKALCTEIFLPRVHFPPGGDVVVQIAVSDGTWRVFDDLQRCVWRCSCRTSQPHIQTSVAGGLRQVSSDIKASLASKPEPDDSKHTGHSSSRPIQIDTAASATNPTFAHPLPFDMERAGSSLPILPDADGSEIQMSRRIIVETRSTTVARDPSIVQPISSSATTAPQQQTANTDAATTASASASATATVSSISQIQVQATQTVINTPRSSSTPRKRVSPNNLVYHTIRIKALKRSTITPPQNGQLPVTSNLVSSALTTTTTTTTATTAQLIVVQSITATESDLLADRLKLTADDEESLAVCPQCRVM